MCSIYAFNPASVLSPLTGALMEDTGFYDVSYSSPYTKNGAFGLVGAGCKFVLETFIDSDNEKVNTYHGTIFL